jgi:hypothetical protein
MKEYVKDLLVTALRSGDYKQTTGKLKTDEGHCCLGVLCELYVKTQKKKGFTRKENGEYHIVDKAKVAWTDGPLQQDGVLPTQVQKWAGMQSETGSFITKKGNARELTAMNDLEKKSFKQIATKIEKYWEQL